MQRDGAVHPAAGAVLVGQECRQRRRHANGLRGHDLEVERELGRACVVAVHREGLHALVPDGEVLRRGEEDVDLEHLEVVGEVDHDLLHRLAGLRRLRVEEDGRRERPADGQRLLLRELEMRSAPEEGVDRGLLVAAAIIVRTAVRGQRRWRRREARRRGGRRGGRGRWGWRVAAVPHHGRGRLGGRLRERRRPGARERAAGVEDDGSARRLLAHADLGRTRVLVDVQQLEQPLLGEVVELDAGSEQSAELLVAEDVIERRVGPRLLADEDERVRVGHSRRVVEQPDEALHLRRHDLATVEGHEPEPVHPVLLADQTRIAQPPPEVNTAP